MNIMAMSYESYLPALTTMFVSISSCYGALSNCNNTENEVDALVVNAEWLETEIVSGFRLWQIIFLAIGGFIVVVSIPCCCMRCRIPRTREEIEANYKRNEITDRFRSFLDKVPVEEIDLVWALDTVKQLSETEQKSKSRSETDSELNLSEPTKDNSNEDDDNYRKMGFWVRIRQMMQRMKTRRKHYGEDEETGKLNAV